jgi:DNA-binding response OmpR family regulator
MLARSPSSTERELRDRIEVLEEQNRQLRTRLRALTGAGASLVYRRAFGLTASEATILGMLIRCGEATYNTLFEAVYADDDFCGLENPNCAVRTHIKRLRRKIRPHGIEFETVYGFGFAMSEEARAAARRKLEAA